MTKEERKEYMKKYRADNKDKKYFGSFTDLELADLVAQEARSKYHGNFANHGR